MICIGTGCTNPQYSARLTPLGSREDWAGGVTRHLVALAVLEEVVPEGRRAALRPQRHSHLREDGGAAVVHVGHVRQPRRDAVAGAEALERVLLLALFRIIICAIKLRRLSIDFTGFVILEY